MCEDGESWGAAESCVLERCRRVFVCFAVVVFLIQMHVKINLPHSQSDWKSARAPHSCSGLLQANHTVRIEQLQASVSLQLFGTGPVPACCHLFPCPRQWLCGAPWGEERIPGFGDVSLRAAASNGKNAVRLQRKRPLEREAGRCIVGVRSSMQFCLLCLHLGLRAGRDACSAGAWLCCVTADTLHSFSALPSAQEAHSTRVPTPVALGVSFGPNPTPGGFPVCASLGWDAASVGCVWLH